MSKQSAGILVYRIVASGPEVLLAHPGGPFFARKDASVWSVPKGEFGPDEDALVAAKREFSEELGVSPPNGTYTDLGTVRSKSGKVNYIFSVEGNLDATNIKSNMFDLEWPPRSGSMQQFSEVDRVGWFSLEKAAIKLNIAQVELLDRLAEKLGIEPPAPKPEQSSLF